MPAQGNALGLEQPKAIQPCKGELIPEVFFIKIDSVFG